MFLLLEPLRLPPLLMVTVILPNFCPSVSGAAFVVEADNGDIFRDALSDGSDSIGPCVKSHASMVCYDMMGRPLPKGSWRKGIIIADGVKILR